MFGARVMVARIQPVWAIDEKAKSFRSWVWLSPPTPPTITDRIADELRIVRLVLLWFIIRMLRGAIFCQVRIIRVVSVVVPCATSGSQKWNGAAAIFIIRAKVMIFMVVVSVVREISQFEVFSAFMVVANRIVMEARVCVRKYFVVASVARGWWGLEIIGTMDRVLISRQTQAISQCVVVVVNKVLMMMLAVMVISDIGLISKGPVDIFGVWAR